MKILSKLLIGVCAMLTFETIQNSFASQDSSDQKITIDELKKFTAEYTGIQDNQSSLADRIGIQDNQSSLAVRIESLDLAIKYLEESIGSLKSTLTEEGGKNALDDLKKSIIGDDESTTLQSIQGYLNKMFGEGEKNVLDDLKKSIIGGDESDTSMSIQQILTKMSNENTTNKEAMILEIKNNDVGAMVTNIQGYLEEKLGSGDTNKIIEVQTAITEMLYDTTTLEKKTSIANYLEDIKTNVIDETRMKALIAKEVSDAIEPAINAARQIESFAENNESSLFGMVRALYKKMQEQST